ncbi:hypothetical protein GS898_13285 [Rhodococcus hoagii]|nr:hypothetical protein [Prescottella equi]
MDKLKAGKQITLADLQEIGAKVAEPEVIAKVADALRDVNAVAVAADNAARKRTLVIDVQALSAAESAWHAAGNYGPAPRPLPERADGGRLPGFAGGGRMPPRSAVDDIYAVTPGGVPIAMVNGDEWVINDEMSEEYDRELAMINAGTFPKLPGFENGGRIAAQRAHAGLAAENGKRVRVRSGQPILGLLELLRSRVRAPEGPRYAPAGTRPSRTSSASGSVPAPSPSSALNIGDNGGGGPNSHMTSMLDGVAFESSSDGVQYAAQRCTTD